MKSRVVICSGGMPMGRRIAVCFVISLGSHLGAAEARPAGTPADHAQRMTEGIELFKSTVRPLLQKHCLECHGGEKVKGGFDLATRESLLEGGADGIVIEPGNMHDSRMLKQLRHEEEPHMPKKKPALAATEIDAIATWIGLGAPYDRPLVESNGTIPPKGIVSDTHREFWSFRPLAKSPPPSVANEAWVRSPVDRFILAKLDAKRIAPNNELARRPLVRRVYFDLIGLPPTPSEVANFERDTRPDAYGRLVDRLLASPQYGERWARHWLDVARFGESHGYEQDYDRPFAYHYRDYVIRALNDGQPFDEFVLWQIAGDELAPDNPQAWFATGFLGAGTHATQITANQAEKERYDELDDTVATIGTAMLGVTIGCARCHDHKFDPIPTRDYYRLLSTFTRTVRSDHDVDLNPAQTRAAMEKWSAAHAPLQDSLKQFERDDLPKRMEAWLQTAPTLSEPEWILLDLQGLKASGGYFGITKTEAQGDGSWLLKVVAGSPDTVAFTAKHPRGQITAIRIEALADKTLPEFGPGWGKDGSFNLTELKITVKPAASSEAAVPVSIVRRMATNDNRPTESPLPWGQRSAKGRDQAAVFTLAEPVDFAEGAELSFTLKFPSVVEENLIGRIRVAVTSGAQPALTGFAVASADFDRARTAVARPRTEWSAGENASVVKVYRQLDSEWLRRERAVSAHLGAKPRPSLVKAMVCSEGLPAIRLHTQGPDYSDKTYVLKRGDLAQKQDEATPGFLQVLMRGPEQENRWLAEPPSDARTPHRRAAFARWITDVENGAGHLLARVIVNRLWQHHFGRGIVATPSDFGATGDAPTHPELLDWLAGELIDHGWRLKHIHRLIVTSATYRQDGGVDEVRRAADPENRLWWHRPPRRLDAEIIRDAMLAVSGKLDTTMFGPGSRDESMTRRSLYFFAKRSQLPPMLVQFDAPDTLQSVGQRMHTTVAPQALLLLNNAQVRNWAKALAARVPLAGTKSATASLNQLYQNVLGRDPTSGEQRTVDRFLGAQARTYPDQSSRSAAWVDLCHALLASNEFIYVE